MRILVAGAGIAGLTAARLLAADGHEVVVAERSPTPRTAGAGLLLHRRAVGVLEAAGFAVRGLGAPLESMAITGASGAVRGAVGGRTAFARPELLEALHRGAREVADVRLGAPVSYPAPPPTGSGRSGTGSQHVDCAVGDRHERFDVVVGADGISSQTRALVQPSVRVLPTGQVCWRGVVEMAVGAGGTELWVGPEARVGTVPLTRGRTYAYVVSAGSTPGDERLLRLLTAGALPDREHRAVSLLLALAPTDRSRLDLLELDHPAWGRGRVALVGDAAHAITPNLGLGAALAVDDAVALTRALRDPDRAVARYRSERHAVTRATQLASRHLGRLAHSTAAVPRAVRALAGLRPGRPDRSPPPRPPPARPSRGAGPRCSRRTAGGGRGGPSDAERDEDALPVMVRAAP